MQILDKNKTHKINSPRKYVIIDDSELVIQNLSPQEKDIYLGINVDNPLEEGICLPYKAVLNCDLPLGSYIIVDVKELNSHPIDVRVVVSLL